MGGCFTPSHYCSCQCKGWQKSGLWIKVRMKCDKVSILGGVSIGDNVIVRTCYRNA